MVPSRRADERGARLALGIDPGTAITGYGIVSSHNEQLALIAAGAITTPSDAPLAERLQVLHRSLVELIEVYRPSEMAVEAIFFNKNVRSAFAVGQARGVALLAAAQHGLTVSEYTPLQVKQTITGYGRATKEQVQRMLPMFLGNQAVGGPDDIADAVAIAICHLHLACVKEILSTAASVDSGIR